MKDFFFITFVLVLLPMISGVETIGPFQLNTNAQLLQVCDNCTFVNLTTVQLPNSTIININTNMTVFERTYNFTFTDTADVGDYIYTTCGDPNGVNTCESVNFKVTVSGSDLQIAESIIYIVFLSVLIFLFCFLLYCSIVIPFRNPRGEDGKIISVNDMKYLKVSAMVFSYLTLMGIFGVMRQISSNYLFLSGTSKIFEWMYWFMLSFILPTIIVTIILVIVMFFENSKIKNALLRGVPVR